jgi:hypothetical protein
MRFNQVLPGIDGPPLLSVGVFTPSGESTRSTDVCVEMKMAPVTATTAIILNSFFKMLSPLQVCLFYFR